MGGLLEKIRSNARSIPPEEIRFGTILNGGVSLAVWMGGAVMELDRLAKARGRPGTATDGRPGDRVYRTLLELAGCTARVDVIAGTSAGGINGAALGIAQVRPAAQLATLRDLWVDQGRIESLLRQPFRGSPTSLLKGDDYFLPALNDALTRLAETGTSLPKEEAPLDLSITTTTLRGNQLVTVDSAGQPLPQSLHAARFHWQRLRSTPHDEDPFADEAMSRTAHRLALAARCTASFPFAFEPVFVPVASAPHADPRDGAPLTPEQQLRPDMADFVAEWGQQVGGRDRSRFVVDGGLLANMPTRAALEAVQAMQTEGPARRVMLLVHPHAERPGDDPPDDPAKPPTLLGTIGGLLQALTAQGSRTLVDELENHNRAAAGRRGTRADVVKSVAKDPKSLDALVAQIYPHYLQLRKWRAARDLARRTCERHPSGDGHAGIPYGWNFERVRRAAVKAQDGWRGELPYVPAEPPDSRKVLNSQGWGWGLTTAIGMAEAAADLLRRLVWLLPSGDAFDAVTHTRATLDGHAERLREAREEIDGIWVQQPVLASLRPDEDYWRLRLAAYQRRMIGGATDLEGLIDRVARNEATAVDEAGSAARRNEVQRALTEALFTPPELGTGVRVQALVLNVVRTIHREVLPVLAGVWEATPASGADGENVSTLAAWRDLLIPRGEMPGLDELLCRLLQLEIASTTLGDEVGTGAWLPVDVVLLSAQAPNAFAHYTRSADDKLAGMSINRFAGFLKRSWRVNDWTWGRVDAASTLCRVVLDPARVRRAAVLSGYLESGASAVELAASTVDEIVAELGLDALRYDPTYGIHIAELIERARSELAHVLDLDLSAEDQAGSMPALADLFAWALHLDIVPVEMPALAAAIRADGVEGASQRSHGALLLAEHKSLLQRLEAGAQDQVSVADRVATLAAFDRAGVGREPLGEEGMSDQSIRIATTAAAVTATVIDSDRSGFSLIKPVTRTIRGAMLLPFWTVMGLSTKSALTRALALVGLAIAAVLLALSLFGALPEGITAPSAAIGAVALLIVFAYSALRSGTLLHGLALLTPVVPLVAFAIERASQSGETATGDAARRGVATVVIVAALVLAFMLLGSLPAARRSVWGALDALADQQELRPADARLEGRARALALARRRTHAVLRAGLRLVPPLAALAAVVGLARWLASESSIQTLRDMLDPVEVLLLGALIVIVVGATLAYILGRQLQVLGTDGQAWSFRAVAHPAGTTTSWSVLYGIGYLALALVLATRDEWISALWGRALLVTALVLGVLLVLVVPVWLPARALSKAWHTEIDRAAELGPTSQPLALDMAARGVAYRAFVQLDPGVGPALRPPLGTRLAREIARQRERSAS